MYPSISGPPPQHPQSPEKQSQLANLSAQFPNFRAVNRNQSVFEGPARLWDGQTTSLRITLPPNFPQERPLLNLGQPVQHPWVDQAGQLKFANLNHWGPQSRLASIVQEALDTLSGQNRNLGSPSRSAETNPTKAATAPTSFPELHTFSTGQLEELLSNKEAFQKLVDSYVGKSQPLHVKGLLAKGNSDLAQANLDKDSEMAEIRNQIAIIRSSEYAAAKEAYDSAFARQEKIMVKIDPKTLINALGRKAQEADDAAEQLHDKMIQREITVEAFVAPYTAQKTLFHRRELKQQAAQQIL